MNTKREALLHTLLGIEKLRKELEEAQRSHKDNIECLLIVERLTNLYMSLDTDTAINAITGEDKAA